MDPIEPAKYFLGRGELGAVIAMLLVAVGVLWKWGIGNKALAEKVADVIKGNTTAQEKHVEALSNLAETIQRNTEQSSASMAQQSQFQVEILKAFARKLSEE